MVDGPMPTSVSDASQELARARTSQAVTGSGAVAAAGSGLARRHEQGRRETRIDVTCRALDLVAGIVVLIIVAPLLLLIALAIKLDSSGPVLFRQVRVGRRQAEFTVVKFRTMQHEADHEVHRNHMMQLIQGNAPAPKLTADDRVTRVGRLLRRTSLDELPQLWNVLSGEMSLVGPRPPIPYEVSNYPEHWFDRFAVKPGITGLWQVNGRSQVSLAEMVRMDVEYAERRSARLNLWILLRTLPAVLSTRGAG
jgi:lipopolysaccharide/colanic/teichoic acid biosynthesis glycosyltransferase